MVCVCGVVCVCVVYVCGVCVVCVCVVCVCVWCMGCVCMWCVGVCVCMCVWCGCVCVGRRRNAVRGRISCRYDISGNRKVLGTPPTHTKGQIWENTNALNNGNS